MNTSKWLRPSYSAGILLLMVAAGLYLLTLDNGLRPDELVGGDLITHQYAQVEGRPSNAPGYPLYTIGGWLWFRLGRFLLGWIFNPIQILSLYSTLWGLASLLMLYLILLGVTRCRWPIALLLAALYGVTFFFWYYTVTTEQYTSAVFQTLLVIWLAFKWDKRPRDSLLLWLAFVSGTMLANMVTTLFILPPLLWFILFRPAESGQGRMLVGILQRPKLVLAAVGAGLLPLLSYSYVYIRGAQHPEWRGQGTWATTGEWFIQFLTIQQGRDELAPGLTGQAFFTAEFPALMWQELTWLVFLGGVLGLTALGRRRAVFLYSTLLIYLLFSWGYRFGNWFQVIIPAYPIFIIGFGAGLTKIIDWTEKQSTTGRQRWQRFVTPGIMILLAALGLYRLAASLPEANQRNRPEDTGLAPGWAILADRPATPAVIAGAFEERVALQYLHTVWGAAANIRPVDVANFHPTEVDRQSGQQIYLTRQAAGIAPDTIELDKVHPQAWGGRLIALWPAPRRELPPTATPLAVDFGHQLELAGWEQVETAALPPSASLPPANWQVVLYWRAPTPLTDDYTISVRPLVGGQLIILAGENLIQDHQPVWGIYPTSRWRAGELVRDVYALSLPPEVRPDAVQIVVYRPVGAGFENLGVATLGLNEPGEP